MTAAAALMAAVGKACTGVASVSAVEAVHVSALLAAVA